MLTGTISPSRSQVALGNENDCQTENGEKGDRHSSVRLGFCKGECSLYAVQQFINSLTHFLLREDYFPLTLTLSPIGGEGKKWDRFNALWLLNPATSPQPSPPASGGEGWGDGGKTTACNFLTGHCWDRHHFILCLSPFFPFFTSIILMVRKTHPTTYSALERPPPPLVSLIMAWAAAIRAMGMRMGEHET